MNIVEDNPFQSPESATEPQTDFGSPRGPLLPHFLRATFACFVLIVVPHLVTPYLFSMIEEFGIDTPRILQMYSWFCDILMKFSFVSIPLTLAAILGLEYFVYQCPNDRFRSSISILTTLFLIGLVIVIVVIFLLPVLAIIHGLSGA